MGTEQTAVGLGARFGARVVDGLVVAPFLGVGYALLLLADGTVALLGGLVVLVGVVLSIHNHVVRVGVRGQSIGKQLLAIRVVDQDRSGETGTPIGVGRALGREVVLGLLFAACFLPGVVNAFLAGRDPRGQGWHDKAVRSVAVRTSGGDPEPPAPRAEDVTTPSYRPAAPTPATPVGPPPPPPSAPVEPPAPPAPVAPVEPSPPVEATVASVPSAHQRSQQSDGVTVVGPPPGTTRWYLTTASGESRELAGTVLVGRDPDPDLVAGAEAWAITDPELTVSKTHARFELEDGAAWVEDWHSTNGVRLHRDGESVEVSPHDRTPVHEGDVVELGTVAITVEVRR